MFCDVVFSASFIFNGGSPSNELHCKHLVIVNPVQDLFLLSLPKSNKDQETSFFSAFSIYPLINLRRNDQV